MADGEWDAKRKIIPRLAWRWQGETAGSRASTEWVLPAGRTKQAGRGRGVIPCGGRYSPPEERSKLAAGGEWSHAAGGTPR